MTIHGGKRAGAGRKTRPNATRRNLYLSNEVYDYLKRNGNASAEIERIVRDEMNEKKLQELAEMIHNEVCGCDDKTCETTTEIYDWLYNGDNPNYTVEDVPDLVAEWKEYSGE